jgi:betaine-homocysteine S-methyltransferase
MAETRGLLQRLADGPVICAEGYLFALEARGYLQAGAYVPEVVLEHPEVVEQLHRELVRCGSDVVEAFTYYAHREKLRLIGREADLEPMNRRALAIAKGVAAEAGALVAGNICNTNVYEPSDPEGHRQCRTMFDEQVGWAADAGVDLIIGETFYYAHEAEIALDAIKAAGLPAVINLAIPATGRTADEVEPATAAKRLEDRGADVVGLNCFRGPWTMLPLIERIREAVSCHVAALPVPYRTTEAQPTFFALTDEGCPCACASPTGRPFPVALDPFGCTRYEMAEFARRCVDMGVRFVGVCCGAEPHHIRAMAEALGRRPEASRYSPDLSKHFALGTDPSLKRSNREFAPRF